VSGTRQATWWTSPRRQRLCTKPPTERTSTTVPGSPSPAAKRRGAAVLTHRTEAERVHEAPSVVSPLSAQMGHAVEAVDRVLARNAGAAPQAGLASAPRSADEFEHQPIVVLDEITCLSALRTDAVTQPALEPESERAWQHGERCDGDPSSPWRRVLAPGQGRRS